MHRCYQELDGCVSFDAPSASEQRIIHMQHTPDRPLGYLFTDLSPNNMMNGYTMYDLVVDESERFARLYTMRTLGDAALDNVTITGELAALGRSELEDLWFTFQRQTGMLLPHRDEKAAFERIFKTFVQVEGARG